VPVRKLNFQSFACVVAQPVDRMLPAALWIVSVQPQFFPAGKMNFRGGSFRILTASACDREKFEIGLPAMPRQESAGILESAQSARGQ
jgi:hypothetical protein